jgi:hypothetical protein
VNVADIVDLVRYPIDDPMTPQYLALVERARSDLAAVGACVLEGFVRQEAVARMVTAVEPKEMLAFHKVKRHNVYLEPDDPTFASDHPRNAKEITTSATLGYDHLRDVEGLVGLFESAGFKSFVAAALGHEELYAYEDELSPINVLYYPPGTALGWHFDSATFTTTLMIREAQRGAAFEYVPFLRSSTDRAFDTVAALRAGDHSLIKTLHQSDGTLVLFTGSRTIHRVTEIEGSVTRLLATMTFSPEPGARLSATNQATFYGRIA